MASSGSGIHDDSLHSANGGATGTTSTSGDFRNASSQVSNSSFNSSGDRAPKDPSHHQQSSREGGRRERHNNNDDPSSRSAPESPKLEGHHRSGSRAHLQSTQHQPYHDHSSYGGRDGRDGGVGDPYQLHAGISENPSSDELVASNNERITQRQSNTQRLSTTSHCGGVGGTCNHQCSNQTQTMPSNTTTSSNAGSMSTSQSASNSGTNSNLGVSPSPPVSRSNTLTNMTPLVSNTIAGEDSDYSDFGQQQPSTSNSRSRQKKFLKNFKQLPQEEVVLQRYSCALVSDILLQGHLYLTENYFAFYSNVFGYVTKLQIPIRSVTIVTKEKTAKIIPNAIGVMTLEHEKHVFSSFISRDTTFKLMTRLWKRAMRDLGPQEECIVDPQSAIALETELDVDEELIEDLPDDISSDSDDGGEHRVTVGIPVPRAGISGCSQTIPTTSPISASPKDIMEASYLVKRMSQSNGTIFYQTRGGLNPAARSFKRSPTGDRSPTEIISANNGRRLSLSSNSTGTKNGNGNLLSQLTKSTIVSIFVIVLLSFLFCSSLYLVFRIDSLQKQVESQGQQILGSPTKDGNGLLQTQNWNDIVSPESSEKMQKVLDSSVDKIAGVRKSLENLASLVRDDNKQEET